MTPANVYISLDGKARTLGRRMEEMGWQQFEHGKLLVQARALEKSSMRSHRNALMAAIEERTRQALRDLGFSENGWNGLALNYAQLGLQGVVTPQFRYKVDENGIVLGDPWKQPKPSTWFDQLRSGRNGGHIVSFISDHTKKVDDSGNYLGSTLKDTFETGFIIYKAMPNK